MELKNIFDRTNSERDKFLSRFLGIFSEEIVRIWCNSPKSPYKNLGRPTIKPIHTNSNEKGKTLDFTLRHKTDNTILVTEMKCEIEYMNYKYLTLSNIEQVKRHEKKLAFEWFLGLAKSPCDFCVTVGGNEVDVDGAALIWGALDPDSIGYICTKTGLKAILSLEQMMTDLLESESEEYKRFLAQLNGWTTHLFNGLGLDK